MLPSDLPNDRMMDSLGWLIHAESLADHHADIVATLPDGGVWVIMNHELVELEARGWIDLSEDEKVTVTAKGSYWHGRWQKNQNKKTSYAPGPLAKGQSPVRLKMGANGSLILKSGGIE